MKKTTTTTTTTTTTSRDKEMQDHSKHGGKSEPFHSKASKQPPPLPPHQPQSHYRQRESYAVSPLSIHWGQVRGTPPGSCLPHVLRRQQPPKEQPTESAASATKKEDHDQDDGNHVDDVEWREWRRQQLPPLQFPVDGYDYQNGQACIQQVDTIPLASASNTKTNPPQDDNDDHHPNSHTKTDEQALFIDEYGSTKTPDDAPVGSLRDKWRLLPYFLRLRSLLRQHIDSYNHFVQTELQQIVSSPSNCEIRSEHDPKFYFRYEQCWVGTTPSIEEDSYSLQSITPFLCRLRDCTYSAPIYVNVRYTRGRQIVVKRNVMIGRMPIMLQSRNCILSNKSDDELAALKECPYDPGGYFIIKGVEKVILIQEQLSKNRVILEEDSKTGGVTASITSSTHERKSKAYIYINKKQGRVYLKSNSLGEDIPICICLKAMGMESDVEMVQLVVGNEPYLLNAMALSLEEPARLQIHTQDQALKYIGTKIRGTKSTSFATTNPNTAGGGGTGPAASQAGGPRYKPATSLQDEARDVLANVVLSHVPVEHYDFRTKAIYIGHIVRRVLLVHLGKIPLDDKDYYGNKRLELAGSLLSLLFEDLFKIFNRDLKRQADMVLSKPNRATAFDVIKTIRTDTITNGMINAIATGNWVLKRFRMDRAGVTQVLTRLSYMSALGMMTRINSQFEKTRKVSGPRSLQPSQWGMLCPADTPEGEACGLVKNLALLAHITTTGDEETPPVERLCRDLGVEAVNRVTGHEINDDSATSTSSSSTTTRNYLVFLNGLILGVHNRPKELVTQLRLLRRQGLTGEFVSVYLHEEQCAVHIATDGGRVCRPLLIVDERTGQPKLQQRHIEAVALGTWTIRDLLHQGLVEYVDCNEENNTLIAVTERDLERALVLERREQEEQQAKQLQQEQQPKPSAVPSSSRVGDQHAGNNAPPKPKQRYTHLEIDPFTVLGVVGGVIPFPHHNQSPRNTYTVAMAKQAMGCIAMNEYERMDGLIYTLVYPHKPLVKSRTLDLVNFDNIPGGQNACMAVMSFSGYDIEDAIILNKASIDRGFGRCMVLRKHQTSVRRYANGTMDQTCAPPDPNLFLEGESDKRYQRYKAVDNDGICAVGELLDSGSIMVNKQSPTDTTSNLGGGADFGFGAQGQAAAARSVQYKPCPLSYKSSAPSYVDKVVITSNENEQFLIKVMVRQVRRPEIGDKFASRHGQKGVCGLIVREEDLPFNEYGHSPDLIMNPHGFPSRMTVGKLLELLVGKAGVYEGRQAYSSAFGEEFGSADTAEAACEALIRNGLNYTGKDVFYSGANGQPLDGYIFSGPLFYQKLKHMVLDKAHARARGPRAVLTRQPTEGRSRDGGLRLGEMERDCLIAYGASNLIMERLMHSSDAFLANVCLTCGLLQYQNWCQYCRSGEKVADIRIPYACKLLFQELQSMNVLPRLRLKDHT